MVYLAGPLELAVLETRVHIEVNATGTPYTAIQCEFPDELVQLVEPPPEGWREKLETTRSISMGSAWLKGGSGLVLAVPSAIYSRLSSTTC